MANELKLFFDKALVGRIGDSFSAIWPAFPRQRFVSLATSGLDQLELMDRARHICAALAQTLPQDRAVALDLISRSVGPEIPDGEGNGMAPFFYLPHVIFVAQHGREHFSEAMRAQHELTRRFSAEFSIRIFLEEQPERTLKQLTAWTRDKNHHVRRLVSEGTRPRLPWAPRLRAIQANPAPVLPLLEALKDDPSEYVRRSVANNLNDIAKDHPDITLSICEHWMKDATAQRQALVTHALRSLIKAGHPRAMAILGYGGGDGISVTGTVEPARVHIGESTRVTLHLKNTLKQRRRVVVDLAVHFVKAAGHAAPKVFKGRNLELGPGEEATFSKSISLRVHTTRKPNAGRHEVDALVAGRAHRVGQFDVLPQKKPQKARSKGARKK